jgi:hypothetical protein
MKPPPARSLTRVWLIGALELEVFEILGQRQLCDGELVLDARSAAAF